MSYDVGVFRTPVIKRVSINSNNNLKRIPIISRIPIGSKLYDFKSCSLCGDNLVGCNGMRYCNPYTSKDENSTDFRIIRVENKHKLDSSYWDELNDQIDFVRRQECNIRFISDCKIPESVMFSLGYSPYNIAQFNLNLLDEHQVDDVKSSIFTSVNCGIYTAFMLYPVIPGITKTCDILDLINRLRYSCKIVCFKFIEVPLSSVCNYEIFNLDDSLKSNYMEMLEDKIVCSQYFKENFCTILTNYLESRNVSCSLCNDCVCY